MNCIICEKNKRFRRLSLCQPCKITVRRYRRKIAAIQYLGGKCNRCGYKKHRSVFQFHHLDPTEKEFQVGRMMNKSWKVIKKELDKCELLCANCHQIKHATLEYNEKLMEYVFDYHGNGKDIEIAKFLNEWKGSSVR